MSKTGQKPENVESNEVFVKEAYKPSPDMIRLTKLMAEKLTKYDDPEAENKVRKIMAELENVSEDDAFFALHDKDYNVDAAIEHLKSLQEENQRSWKEVVKIAKKKPEPRIKSVPEQSRAKNSNSSARSRGSVNARGDRKVNNRAQPNIEGEDRRLRTRRGRGRANFSQSQRGVDRFRTNKTDELNSITNGEFDFVTEFEDWDGSLNESQVFVSSKLADKNVDWNEANDPLNFDDPFACMEQFDPSEVEERVLSGKGIVVESSVASASCTVDRLAENKAVNSNDKVVHDAVISEKLSSVLASKDTLCPVVMPPSSDSDDISNLGLQFGTWDIMSQKTAQPSYASKTQRGASNSQTSAYQNEMRYKQINKNSQQQQPMTYKESFTNSQAGNSLNQLPVMNRQQHSQRSSQHPASTYDETGNANFMINESAHNSLIGNMKDHSHLPPHPKNLNASVPVSNFKHMNFPPGLLGPQSFVVSQPGMPQFVPMALVSEYYSTDSSSWVDYCRNIGVSAAAAGPISTASSISVSSDKRNGPSSNASFPPPGFAQPTYGYQYAANPNDGNISGATYKVDKHQYHSQQAAAPANFAFSAQQPQNYPCMPMCGPMTGFQDGSRPVSASMTTAPVGVPKQTKFKTQGEWFNQ